MWRERRAAAAGGGGGGGERHFTVETKPHHHPHQHNWRNSQYRNHAHDPNGEDGELVEHHAVAEADGEEENSRGAPLDRVENHGDHGEWAHGAARDFAGDVELEVEHEGDGGLKHAEEHNGERAEVEVRQLSTVHDREEPVPCESEGVDTTEQSEEREEANRFRRQVAVAVVLQEGGGGGREEEGGG